MALTSVNPRTDLILDDLDLKTLILILVYRAQGR